MFRLWTDVRSHKIAAMLLFLYWLATLALAVLTWDRGIPLPVVLLMFTTPLLGGALVGWWQPDASTPVPHRIVDGALAGSLIAAAAFLFTKGGAGDEVLGWMNGQRFQGDEVAGFLIFVCAAGAGLGAMGAALMKCIRLVRKNRDVGQSG
jgi:hypothetical protein